MLPICKLLITEKLCGNLTLDEMNEVINIVLGIKLYLDYCVLIFRKLI